MVATFKIDKVFHERETRTICITTDKEQVIEICNQINGDYNVALWINGKFSNVYMDIREDEIRELFIDD